MARKKKSDVNIDYYGEVEERSLQHVLDYSYVRYSTHAILQRAIPDSRDGLKPAQRRLLFAMHKLGLSEGTKYTKCAKICGQTSGDYHPHGESVLYPTLTRMVQDWVLRYPLVSGQGNFGTVDGLDAAAMRYTEARLSPFGVAVVESVNDEAVNFQLNYTETEKEPMILPGLFPNLLCNGGSGIAVSIACNFAPHNLREISAVIRECVMNKTVTADRLLELMPGPDFPTGGILRGQNATKQYYTTGKATLTLDGVWDMSLDAKGNRVMTVTELPYGSSPDKLAQQIAELVNNKRVDGITDLKELSHRKDGQKCIRILITLSKSADEKIVFRTLLRHTCLRSTFSVNQTAVVGGRATENVSIVELARSYYDHRLEVLRRRSEAELARLIKRTHILEGLVSVCSRIREAVDVILESESPQNAKELLVSKGFVTTEEQANAVLEISLKRLTKMELNQLLNEKDETEKRAKKLEKLLSSNASMRDVVLKQLDDFAATYGDDRRTQIGNDAEAVVAQDLIRREDITVVVNRDGYTKRAPSHSEPSEQGVVFAHSNTIGHIVFVTDHGMAYCRQGHEIPDVTKGNKGTHIGQLLGCKPDEKVIAVYDLESASLKSFVLATNDGSIKRLKGSDFESKKRAGLTLMKMSANARLLCALPSIDNGDVFVATEQGKGICYPIATVPTQGRNSAGVGAMRLSATDKIVQIILLDHDFEGLVFFITSLGYVKKTTASKFKCYSGRRAIGKNTIDNIKGDRTGLIVGMAVLPKNGVFVVHTKEGETLTLNPGEVRDTEKPIRKVTPSDGDELIAMSMA